MRIYQMTEIGGSEASSPDGNPLDAKRVLYYLRKRSNYAASDDMITWNVFGGDKGKARPAISRLLKAKAVRSLG